MKTNKYRCSNPWTTLFVWGNGDVTHCCYANVGPIGNINKNSIEEIWKSKKLQRIRKAIYNGNYIKAGCESFCRAYRWADYYKDDPTINIPDGLGRSDIHEFDEVPDRPKIISLAMDWKCNFNCTHCRAGRTSKGLSPEQIEHLWPTVKDSDVVRLSNGEFTVNKQTLDYIQKIGLSDQQPIVFMNTNGHNGIDNWFESIENVKRFHLKFSLEGLDEDYNKIRIGGTWDNYYKNLSRAIEIFDKAKKDGKDWKLYLNFCVMKSNFFKLSEVVEFSVKHQLPLVVNPIHGMRHTEENIFAFEHLRIPEEKVKAQLDKCRDLLKNKDYVFNDQLIVYLDYIEKYLADPKFRISEKRLSKLKGKYSELSLDRLLQISYKWQSNKPAFLRYVYHKALLKSGIKYF